MKRLEHNPITACSECIHKESLFCCLSSEDRDQLTARRGCNFYRKGLAIFYEGNYPCGLYCSFSGRIKLSKLAANGKEQIVRLVSPGDVFGYRSLLSGELYRATAIALADSQVCMISKEDFMKSLENNWKLSNSVIQLLARDLGGSEHSMLGLAQKTACERLAETLLILMKKFGLREDNSLDVVLSRREIGDIVGITTETSIRTLSDFKKKGLIDLVGKRILIRNSEALLRMASLYD